MFKPTSDHGICKKKRLAISLFLVTLALVSPCSAGQNPAPTPVFTDDSPQAAQWFDRASEQIRTGNTAEALRLYQRLLDQFPNRLLRTDENSNSFTSVRLSVQNALRGQPDLLAAYVENNDAIARRLLEEGRPEDVFVSRFLTPAGLTAALDLAESALVRARFDFTIDILDQCEQHPSLEGPGRVRWATLSVLTGVYGGRKSLVEHAIGSLAGSPDGPRLAALAASLESTFVPPQPWRSVSPAAALDGATLRQMGKSPTWRYDMEAIPAGSANTRRGSWPDNPDPRAIEETVRLLAVMPVVTSDFVYIHNGMTLTALDRFDGRERWSADYRLAPSSPDNGRFGGGIFDSVSVQNDPRIVAVDQDRVVAIVSRPVNDPDLRTMVVCHDAGSGGRLWTTTPGGIHPDLDGATFVGSPVVHDGLVLLTARKQTLRLVSDYLVAIELASGRHVWHQHVASSAIFGYYAVLPATVPIVQDGMVFLSTPLGAMTAIDARTGLVRWLNVLEPFGARMRGDLTAPSTYDSMLLTPKGLIAFTPSRHGVVVLDPQTGAQRSFHASSLWGDPLYLVQTDDAILAIGDSITRIPLDDLDLPTPDWVPLRGDEFLNGRVTSGPGKVFIPTNQRLRILDNAGHEMEFAEINQLAVPLVVGGEVLLASIDRIESFIPYAVGEPHLRARLEANPHDPNPAISLARLAFQHRKLDALMSSIDRAIDIINADPLSEINTTAQQRLFSGLLDMAPHSVLPDDLSNAIYYRLELLAATPQQRLAYLLSHASSLALAGQAAAAIDSYQAVLTTPALTGEPWTEAGSTRPAEDVARSRLTQLVVAGHRDLYRSYEDAAQREFDQARARGTPEDLVVVARRYPLAEVASNACITASHLLQARGEEDAAVSVLRFAVELNPPHPALDAVRSELLQRYESRNETFEALLLLRSIGRMEANATIPTADGRTLSLDQWRARIETNTGASDRFGVIGPLGTMADLKEGQLLLTPRSGPPSSQYALVRDNRNLVGYDSTNAARFIELLDSTTKELLVVDKQFAILGTLVSRGLRTFDAYDMANQRLAWQSTSFDNWFAGQGGVTSSGQLLPAATSDRIVLAEDTGRVGCLNRQTGEVEWAVTTHLDAINFVSATDTLVMVAGETQSDARRGRREAESSHVLLLRPETGAMITDLQTDHQAPLDFAFMTPRGEVVYASLGRLYCYDTLRREQRWAIDTEFVVGPMWAGLIGSTLLVFDSGGQAISISLETAAITPQPVIQRIERSQSPTQVIPHRDRYILKTHNGVYVIEGDGTITGLMAGSGNPGVTVQSVACAEDRIVAVLTIENAARAVTRSVEINTMDLTGRRLDRPCELADPVELPRPDGLQVLDGWIVLDVGRDIEFMPAPAETRP